MRKRTFNNKPFSFNKHIHPGLAINLNEDNTYVIKKGNYLYRQFIRAGDQEMKVFKTAINRPEVFIAAFAKTTSNIPMLLR